MPISTNSIIHYTDSLEKLKSILREGFRIKYCAEELRLGKKGKSRAAHPMVSFCDIPLSESEQHFDAYGRYGIGLSKEWAIRNGVNPVIYIDKDSLIAKSIHELIKERRKSDSNLTRKQKREILQIKSYAKNYTGLLKRKSIKNNAYRFYDEREWRLVPSKDVLNNVSFSVSLNVFLKSKEKYNKKLEKHRIDFKHEDISYVIVSKTSEIHQITQFMRKEYTKKCSSSELDILFSKICSTEQIIADY